MGQDLYIHIGPLSKAKPYITICGNTRISFTNMLYKVPWDTFLHNVDDEKWAFKINNRNKEN